MDEKQMNQNQPARIDSYDGAPDEAVFFQNPIVKNDYTEAAAAEAASEQTEDMDAIVKETRQYLTDGADEAGTSASQWIPMANKEAPTALGVSPMGENRSPAGTTAAQDFAAHTIDPNDPHYAGYVPDLYYDYGYGAEPKPVRPSDAKADGSALGIISMSTGIASNLLCCCSWLGVLLALTALVTGIWCLCLKYKSGKAKVYAIIGIICAVPTLLTIIALIVWNVLSIVASGISVSVSP